MIGNSRTRAIWWSRSVTEDHYATDSKPAGVYSENGRREVFTSAASIPRIVPGSNSHDQRDIRTPTFCDLRRNALLCVHRIRVISRNSWPVPRSICYSICRSEDQSAGRSAQRQAASPLNQLMSNSSPTPKVRSALSMYHCPRCLAVADGAGSG